MRFSTLVLNLDRHTERLATLGAALDAQGITWSRFAAIDASNVSDEDLDRMVAVSGPIPRMPRGARACTAGHMKMLAQIADGPDDFTLILEDDAEVSPHLRTVLEDLLERGSFDILNLNRQAPTKRPQKKLIVGSKARDFGESGEVRDLVGIHYGTAGYLVSRSAAGQIISVCPRPNMPIDHVLFNPNISPLFGRIRIEQLFPALVRPSEGLTSSIQLAPVDEAASTRNRLKRAIAEIGIIPRLLMGLATRNYRVCDLEFRDTN